MKQLTARQILPALIIATILIIGAVALAQRNNSSSEQPTPTTTTQPEQINDDTEEAEAVQPDINSQEFKLTSSNVSCSTTTMDGQTSRNCSGNIRVVPLTQPEMDPGLYKINEQTKLLKDGVEQDLNSLQQLSQDQTTVRLTLADDSEDTLKEIRY